MSLETLPSRVVRRVRPSPTWPRPRPPRTARALFRRTTRVAGTGARGSRKGLEAPSPPIRAAGQKGAMTPTAPKRLAPRPLPGSAAKEQVTEVPTAADAGAGAVSPRTFGRRSHAEQTIIPG